MWVLNQHEKITLLLVGKWRLSCGQSLNLSWWNPAGIVLELSGCMSWHIASSFTADSNSTSTAVVEYSLKVITFCMLVRKSFFVLWRKGLVVVICCCLNFGKGFCHPGLPVAGLVLVGLHGHVLSPHSPFWAEKKDCSHSNEIPSEETFRFSSLICLLSSSPYWLHYGDLTWSRLAVQLQIWIQQSLRSTTAEEQCSFAAMLSDNGKFVDFFRR